MSQWLGAVSLRELFWAVSLRELFWAMLRVLLKWSPQSNIENCNIHSVYKTKMGEIHPKLSTNGQYPESSCCFGPLARVKRLFVEMKEANEERETHQMHTLITKWFSICKYATAERSGQT